GKKVSALNALKHGLTSPMVVLPDENRDEYDDVRLKMMLNWAPQGALETFLVEQIAFLAWRLLRSTRAETGMLRLQYEEATEEGCLENLIGEAFSRSVNSGSLDGICRYETSIQRNLSRAVELLSTLQEKRMGQYNDPQIQDQLREDREIVVEQLIEECPDDVKLLEVRRQISAAAAAGDDFGRKHTA